MTATARGKRRPKHLNLLRIRLPLPALISILHRISGCLLALASPWLFWAIERAVSSEAAFYEARVALSSSFATSLALLMLWALLHHLLAGIRLLALDLGFGAQLRTARISSWVVLALSGAPVAFIGSRLL